MAVPASPSLAASAPAPGYRLSRNADGSVVRWNSCAAVHYRVNTSSAPPGALGDVKAAVTRLSRATGMVFVYDGTTRTVPGRTYGGDAQPWNGRVPPVVIAWASPGKGKGRSDALSGARSQVGVAGWRTAWWSDGRRSHAPRIVTGYVVINKSSSARLSPGFGAGGRGPVLMHELGHVVGLEHVDDSRQLMYPTMTSVHSYSPGDLSGLRQVGRRTRTAADCLP
ncbi:MAG: matrixin family metalloprotease [Kineosporiaceae bacterium]